MLISWLFVALCATNFLRARRIAERFRGFEDDLPDTAASRGMRPLLWTVGSARRIRVIAVLGVVMFGGLILVNR